MAEGGYDPERIDPREMRKSLDADIEYNTNSVSSNLTTDESFDLEPVRSKSPSLEKRESEITSISMEDWLDNALYLDKRIWKNATKEGKKLFAARLFKGLDNKSGKPAIAFKTNYGNIIRISEENY